MTPRLRVVHVALAATVATPSDGDLWPAAWADDDWLYTANGDGCGFAPTGWSDLVVNRVDGTPASGLTGERLAAGEDVAPIWGNPAHYNRKPTGMLAVDGDGDGRDELYLAVQDLRCGEGPGIFDDAPTATIVRSDDRGRTWSWPAEPMFTGHAFTTVMFLDRGRSNGGSDVVFAYGLDGNWRASYAGTVPHPEGLLLARVPASSVQDVTAWEFFAGFDAGGTPTWGGLDAREPVLRDATRRDYPGAPLEGPVETTVISQGGVTWNPGLGLYVYSSWSEYTFEFWTAPEPWGPWEHAHSRDFGTFPWDGPRSPLAKHGGYATTIPSKFISADGRDAWLQSNWFWPATTVGGNSYHYSLRPVRLDPGVDADPDRPATDAEGLERDGIPLVARARDGRESVLNDGDRDAAEDSWGGPAGAEDCWGYTWPSPRWISRLVYVTGPRDVLGGWYADTPRVEVRDADGWRPARDVRVDPAYPGDATALEQRVYTFDFAADLVDGVRIVGRPGGSGRYTSIAELEVSYRS
ncbi:hypothetical protein [Pseudolysinimonas sp.]